MTSQTALLESNLRGIAKSWNSVTKRLSYIVTCMVTCEMSGLGALRPCWRPPELRRQGTHPWLITRFFTV
jgi:hypothetical protein